jgi:hypothetical protein
MEPAEIFNRAYDILVLHAGAVDDEDHRTDFVCTYMDTRATEYRFGGRLGFGGKFWRNDHRYYISCYREDYAKGERPTIIDRCNTMLAELPYYEPRRSSGRCKVSPCASPISTSSSTGTSNTPRSSSIRPTRRRRS